MSKKFDLAGTTCFSKIANFEITVEALDEIFEASNVVRFELRFDSEKFGEFLEIEIQGLEKEIGKRLLTRGQVERARENYCDWYEKEMTRRRKVRERLDLE